MTASSSDARLLAQLLVWIPTIVKATRKYSRAPARPNGQTAHCIILLYYTLPAWGSQFLYPLVNYSLHLLLVSLKTTTSSQWMLLLVVVLHW